MSTDYIRAMEVYNRNNNTTTVTAHRNPTREELIAEAREAFSNPYKEHLYDVKRVKDTNGTTMSISGRRRIVKPMKLEDMRITNGAPVRKQYWAEQFKPQFKFIDNFKYDVLPDIKRKWAEWVGELTRYSDSAGSIWIKNEVPKETALRKLLNVLRRVK